MNHNHAMSNLMNLIYEGGKSDLLQMDSDRSVLKKSYKPGSKVCGFDKSEVFKNCILPVLETLASTYGKDLQNILSQILSQETSDQNKKGNVNGLEMQQYTYPSVGSQDLGQQVNPNIYFTAPMT